MNPVEQLLNIASELAEADPALALELERSVLAATRSAVINPGVQKFEDHVEKMVTVLKSMVKELDDGLKEISTDDAAEFAKFFEDVVDAEEQQLKALFEKSKTLKTAARLAARTAGPLDFVKNIFKKKPAEEDKSETHAPYSMNEEEMDSFVDGKSDWAEGSKYIEKEFKENKEFFDGVAGLLTQFKRVKKSPSRALVESLKDAAQKLIKTGENIMKGIRNTLKQGPKVEITEDGLGDKKAPAKNDKISPERLESTVDHYTDMLKESLGDEKKTLKFLKELFQAVGPLLDEERASIAAKKILPVLVRTAHATPKARPVLIPVIRRIVNANPPASAKVGQ